MSLRYPTVARSPWLPHTIAVLIPGPRDVYGKATIKESVNCPALCEITTLEVEVDKSRSKRAGLIVEVPGTATNLAAIDVGTIIAWSAQEYTVIGVNAKPGTFGEFDMMKLTAVRKAGDAVVT